MFSFFLMFNFIKGEFRQFIMIHTVKQGKKHLT